MTKLREFGSRLRSLFGKRRRESDLNDEVASHLELLAQENVRRGLSPHDAQTAARRDFGAIEQIKETYRERRGLPMLETFGQDLRYGVRMLRKNPGFTAVAILTLALGVGANTAIFGVVNALLLTPLRFKDPDRLVMVWESLRTGNNPENNISPANFLQWQEHSTVFEQMAAMYDDHLNLTGEGEPEQIPYKGVSPNFFTLLGVAPFIGQNFSADNGIPGKDQVVILSFGLWQRKFGGDPGIIGKSIQVDAHPYSIIGVMPRDFQLFVKEGSFTGEQPEMWEPIAFTDRSRKPRGRYMSAIARLKTGVSLAQAQSQMDILATALEKQWPDFDKDWGINLVPIREQFVGEFRPALLVLLGAVAFILLIACTNVANLLLARAAQRHREIAIRSALGAGRKRITRQLLTESIMLAGFGGALGLLLAIWGSRLLIALGPKDMLGSNTVAVDWRVLSFTMVVSLVTGILFGLGPSLVALSSDVNADLKEGGRDSSGSTRGNRMRYALIVLEMGLALVLLVGSGLCVRSFILLESVNPGFDSHNLLTMKLSLPNAAYPTEEKRIAFYRELIARTAALPGVHAASADSWLPFTTLGAATDFQIVGRATPAISEMPVTDVRIIEPDYFRTMGIPVLAGREFNERESTAISHVVIINQALATNFFPNENPIGKLLMIDMNDPKDQKPTEIVGVVGNVKHEGLNTTPRAMIYWPHPELALPFMTLVVRTEANPLSLVSAVRDQVKSLDPTLPISDVATMEQRMADSVAQARFSTLLLSLFAGLAIVLASVGIYGVTAYGVTTRTHEIGLRMALGAQPGDVRRIFLGRTLRASLLGLGLGLLASIALTRLLASLLFHISPYDPATFIAMALLLCGVALLASYIPARRATRVDPLVALRHE